MQRQTTSAVKQKSQVGAVAAWVLSVAETTNEPLIRRLAYQVLRNSSGSLAIFAAIRCASSRSASWFFGLQNFSAELFLERAGRLQIGKAPSKVNLVFYDNSPSVPHLNFSRAVKVHHPAAHLDVQFIFRDGKLDDVGIFALVFARLPAEWLAHHNGPLCLLADQLRQFSNIRRDPLGLIAPGSSDVGDHSKSDLEVVLSFSHRRRDLLANHCNGQSRADGK